jgi:hypothetical protein
MSSELNEITTKMAATAETTTTALIIIKIKLCVNCTAYKSSAANDAFVYVVNLTRGRREVLLKEGEGITSK